MKLKDWLAEWLEVCVKNYVKLKTYNRYKEIIDLHINPYFEDVDVKDLNYPQVVKFIAEKRLNGNLKTGKELSHSSVNGIIIVLKYSLNEAVEFGYIDTNPLLRIKKQRGEPKDVDALSIVEQRRLEKYIMESEKSYYIGILISLYTGLRIGELIALKWTDIDLKTRMLTVSKTVSYIKNYEGNYINIIQKPKTTSSNRMIPLPAELCKMLKEEKKKGSVYVVTKNDKSITIRGYQYIFENILKKTNLRKVGFHSLRHTFATRAMECGFDVKTLSEIMGHSSVAITINLYTHNQTAHKKSMMDKLNKIYPR